MTSEQIVDYYWAVLKRAEKIKTDLTSNNISETSEVAYMRGIAVAELIRHFVKFKLIKPEKEIVQTKGFGIFQMTTVTQNDDTRPECVVITAPDGVEYTCELTLLQNIMKKDYKQLILKISDDGKAISSPIDIVIPDLPDEETTAVKEIKEIKEKEKPVDQQEYTDDRIPEFGHDGRYKDDAANKKGFNTFLCNQHDMTINSNLGSGIIHFYVYPLSVKTNEKATDIFVIAEAGGICRTSISRGKTSSVEIEFEKISFAVRGSFENGNFVSMVKPLTEGVLDNCQEALIQHIPEVRMSTTYMQAIVEDGILCNIFPAKFNGNYQNTGLCPAGIVIERNKQLEIVTPNSEGSFTIKGTHNEDISLITYWTGGDTPVFRLEMD